MKKEEKKKMEEEGEEKRKKALAVLVSESLLWAEDCRRLRRCHRQSRRLLNRCRFVHFCSSRWLCSRCQPG